MDVKEGQKTGFFLDQKYNRQSIRKLCKDAKVLDCFTHTGSFALNAGQAGAKSVLGLDASELGVEHAIKMQSLTGSRIQLNLNVQMCSTNYLSLKKPAKNLM